MNPVDPVQRQLDAYNARDLAAFVAQYADDVQVFRLPGTQPTIVGKAALAEHYAKNRFNLPSLHAALVARMAFGNKVIDHELITGIAAEPVHAAAIYEVRGGLISTVWFVNPA
ncbi:MAG: nuclear transport factor 2 family protein [Vitreoscilla sp.]|nr:nuclear transport factor 2 family protein [Vitreoscilla sp.]